MRSIRNYTKDIAGAFVHGGSWLLSGIHDTVYNNPNYQPSHAGSGDITIYCTHGTADRVGAFDLMAKRLLSHLPSNITSIHLVAYTHRGRGVDISHFSRQLRDNILANKHKNVILLGHSRGGLVNAYFSEYLAAESDINVLGVISLCTPFSGSYLAKAPLSWLSASVKQMKNRSEFLKQLADRMRQSKTRYLYYVANKDDVVHPKDCCYLDSTLTI